MSDEPPDDQRLWTRIGADRIVHEGWIRVAKRTYRLPDGRTAVWDMFAGGESVGVLALTADGRVVLVRQFRPGPDRLVLNVPGGFVDEGESPVEAAARELTEETGFVSTSLERVATLMSAASTGRRHVVLARDCVATGVQRLDEYEDCEPVVLTIEELRAELRAGQMTGSDLVYLGLDHAGLL